MVLSEEEWRRVHEYVQEGSRAPVKEKRIRAITVNPAYRWQPKIRIEVGRYYSNLEPDAPREQVIAIFESASFLVCTPSRGGGRGVPYFFSREDVRQVELENPGEAP